MRAAAEDVKTELRDLDPHEVGDLPERVQKMESAITTAEKWRSLA